MSASGTSEPTSGPPTSPATSSPYVQTRRELVSQLRACRLLASFGGLAGLVGEGEVHKAHRRWLIELLRARADGVPIVVPPPEKPLVLPADFHLFAPPRWYQSKPVPDVPSCPFRTVPFTAGARSGPL